MPLFDATTKLEHAVLYDRGDAIVTRWNELANDALRDPKVRDQISALDFDIRGGTAKDFANFIALDIGRSKKLAADMGLAED